MSDKNTAPAAAKTPTAPAAPTTPAAAAPKEPKKVLQSVFDTAEAAQKEAASRTKGARRAFTCTGPDGKVIHCVANNEGRAGGVAFEKFGGKVVEIGKTAKAKVASVDGLLAALAAMSPEDQAKIQAALAGLKK